MASPKFRKDCLCLVIDEAHAISEWGTEDFRADYADIGLLRSRLAPGTPIVAASATLPPDVILDIQQKLTLTTDCARVAISNAKPNVALSVCTIKFPEDSFADLVGLIPAGATTRADIPVTLVYVNNRTDAEDIQDVLRAHLPDSIPASAVEFYHRYVDQTEKESILARLRTGELRIVGCTDALGWVSCDLFI